MKETWSLTALVSASVATLAIAACGGGGGNTTATTAPPPSATTNQINAMPRDKVQDGGTFTWAMEQMPTNFNLNELDGTELDGQNVMAALLPGTFNSDARGTPIWDKNYLASEPTLTTDPKQIVMYEINPKAVWYDGTPITWEDFFWQWKASNGSDKVESRISSSTGYEDIEKVEKGKDDREVIVTFRHKFADWSELFNQFYPASTNKDSKIFNEGWKDTPHTTAGPFKLGSLDSTGKTITLVRNEKWWGDRPKLDKIVFRSIETDAQIDALANGELDAMDIGPDANAYNRAKAIAGAEVRVAGGPNFRHLTMNGTSPNLEDVKVRQALAMAINRATIAKALLVRSISIHSRSTITSSWPTRMATRTTPVRLASTTRTTPSSCSMKPAGNWTAMSARRTASALEITCVIPTAVSASRQESELIQNMLGQVGVTLRINTVPSQDFFDKDPTPGQFDFTVFSWIGTPYPISSNKWIYAKPTKNSKGELEIKQNFARTGSDDIDQLFDQANQELDRKKAIDIANRLDSLIWQEVHSLPLYQRPELVVSKKNLANFGAFGFASPWTYQDIGWAKP